jgi:hypothetical protein
MKDDGLQNLQNRISGTTFLLADCHEWHWKRKNGLCVFPDGMIAIWTFVFQRPFFRNPNLPNYDKHSSHDRFFGNFCNVKGSKACTSLRTKFRYFFLWNRILKEASALCTHSRVSKFHHGRMVLVA